ncbi:hypothetical protein A2U01_0015294, partial [Trifolium medium]|nr:hypothetical protein [Trifolium medium]
MTQEPEDLTNLNQGMVINKGSGIMSNLELGKGISIK